MESYNYRSLPVIALKSLRRHDDQSYDDSRANAAAAALGEKCKTRLHGLFKNIHFLTYKEDFSLGER